MQIQFATSFKTGYRARIVTLRFIVLEQLLSEKKEQIQHHLEARGFLATYTES